MLQWLQRFRNSSLVATSFMSCFRCSGRSPASRPLSALLSLCVQDICDPLTTGSCQHVTQPVNVRRFHTSPPRTGFLRLVDLSGCPAPLPCATSAGSIESILSFTSVLAWLLNHLEFVFHPGYIFIYPLQVPDSIFMIALVCILTSLQVLQHQSQIGAVSRVRAGAHHQFVNTWAVDPGCCHCATLSGFSVLAILEVHKSSFAVFVFPYCFCLASEIS